MKNRLDKIRKKSKSIINYYNTLVWYNKILFLTIIIIVEIVLPDVIVLPALYKFIESRMKNKQS